MKKSLSAGALLSTMLATLAALATLNGCAAHRPPPGTVEVHLVTLNDFHGNIEASKYVWDSASGGGERTIQAGGIDTLGAALQAWRKEDPELLGGAVIKVGSTVYDGSVRGQLDQMKQRLVAAAG